MKPRKYLFLYTIGPVQSFIASARKTHDLWSGSFLLSELSRKTALHAQNKYKANPVFPAVDAGKKFMPNRFLVFIEAEDISQVGRELVIHTRTLLQQRADEALHNVKGKPDGFDKQLDQFLQIHWAALPCEKEQYPDKFADIERMLAAAKNVRAFKPLQEEPGRKCSLSGERIALFYDARKKPWCIVPHAVPVSGFRLNPGEAMDTIGFIKRLGYPRTSLPSTAEISLRDFLSSFKERKSLEKYRDHFGPHFDEQLYYKENLTDSYFRKQGIPEKLLSKAKDKLAEIYDEAEKEKLIFQKYYAVVMLDGDNVGAWLSGSKFNNESQFSREKLLDYHEHLSEKLGSYARDVDVLFSTQKEKGELIYCGGDDVLAFVNLTHLISVLKYLRGKLPDLDGTGRYTATAGVVVAHYKTPLSEVLKWVRKIEKEAKHFDEKEKNKLAIAVLKHSGEIEKCVIPWYLLDNTPVLDILHRLRSAWKDELLSASFVRQLFRSFQRLLNDKGEFENENLLSVELGRLIKRSRLEKGKTGAGKENIDILVKQLNQFLIENQKLKDFMSFLSIADFMERKVK